MSINFIGNRIDSCYLVRFVCHFSFGNTISISLWWRANGDSKSKAHIVQSMRNDVRFHQHKCLLIFDTFLEHFGQSNRMCWYHQRHRHHRRCHCSKGQFEQQHQTNTLRSTWHDDERDREREGTTDLEFLLFSSKQTMSFKYPIGPLGEHCLRSRAFSHEMQEVRLWNSNDWWNCWNRIFSILVLSHILWFDNFLSASSCADPIDESSRFMQNRSRWQVNLCGISQRFNWLMSDDDDALLCFRVSNISENNIVLSM